MTSSFRIRDNRRKREALLFAKLKQLSVRIRNQSPLRLPGGAFLLLLLLLLLPLAPPLLLPAPAALAAAAAVADGCCRHADADRR